MKNIWEVWRAALSPEECDAIIAKASNYPEREARVGFGENNRLDKKLRESIVRWFPVNKERELVDRLMEFVNSSNRSNFGFDLVAPYEVQFTEYHGTNSGNYGWHHDVRLDSQKPFDRKLSVVVQLSDPADYEGGQFEFQTAPHPGEKFVQRGTILLFPSFLAHRVLPVTKGVRYSLVTWVEGPKWR